MNLWRWIESPATVSAKFANLCQRKRPLAPADRVGTLFHGSSQAGKTRLRQGPWSLEPRMPSGGAPYGPQNLSETSRYW